MQKRDFLKASALALMAPILAPVLSRSFAAPKSAWAQSGAQGDGGDLPDLAARARPISASDYAARIDKAQKLMRDAGLSALVLEPGSSLVYFTGLHLRRSERFHGAVIPADGDIALISPAFEEASLREKMATDIDVRVWDEHENPFRLVHGVLKDRKAPDGPIGIEATVRHFIADGIKASAPERGIAPAHNVVTGCRAIKSAAEIALMQIANEITLAAYRATVPRLEAGMEPADFSRMMNEATKAMGGTPLFSMALFGPASAFPHGSSAPQILADGDIVLMDCGCAVEGYQSDISRTIVFGTPSKRQRQVWAIKKEAQLAAFAVARPGVPCEKVDEAARAIIEKHGFGPGYAVPGLPHRTGHGIGLDGHESPNFVKGESTLIAPGMCFSDEPGIYIPGEFGVRLEDCLWIGEDGPHWFTEPAASIDNPLNL